MSKNTMQQESRRLSVFLGSRVGEICFSFCLAMSIAIMSYFSNLSIAAQTGMELAKISYGVILFYAAGSFFMSFCFAVLYVWTCFYKN